MGLIEYEYVEPVLLSPLAMKMMIASFPLSLKVDIRKNAFLASVDGRNSLVWRGIAWSILTAHIEKRV